MTKLKRSNKNGGPIDKLPIPIKCNICGGKVVLTSNAKVYGKKYGNGKCYLCTKCGAYVGVHYDLKTPLGILSDKGTKHLRIKAHNMFDVYWKEGKTSRSKCYSLLAEQLGINPSECHFGWFDKKMLGKAIKILEKGLFMF